MQENTEPRRRKRLARFLGVVCTIMLLIILYALRYKICGSIHGTRSSFSYFIFPVVFWFVFLSWTIIGYFRLKLAKTAAEVEDVVASFGIGDQIAQMGRGIRDRRMLLIIFITVVGGFYNIVINC